MDFIIPNLFPVFPVKSVKGCFHSLAGNPIHCLLRRTMYKSVDISRISDILEDVSVTINMGHFVDFWINEAELVKSNRVYKMDDMCVG